MLKYFASAFVLWCLAFYCISCTQCEECQNDLSARFRFVDSLRTEVFKDESQVQVVDFNGEIYQVERTVVEEDTLYSVDLASLLLEEERPDTVLFLYNNELVDSAAVNFTFSSDSRCCSNTQKVGKLTFFNKQAAKRIKPLFSVYDIIID